MEMEIEMEMKMQWMECWVLVLQCVCMQYSITRSFTMRLAFAGSCPVSVLIPTSIQCMATQYRIPRQVVLPSLRVPVLVLVLGRHIQPEGSVL